MILACCADCQAVFGVCDETGQMVDLQRLTLMPFSCPACTKIFTNFNSMSLASLDEIHKLGYLDSEVSPGHGQPFN